MNICFIFFHFSLTRFCYIGTFCCLTVFNLQVLACGRADNPCHQGTVIVGAGLAGLTAAYELNKAGVPVVLYEARNQVGGKVRSATYYDIQIEEGGLFINSDHKSMVSYAQNFGFDLIDKTKSDVSGLPVKTIYLLGSEELSSKAFYERYRLLIEYLGSMPYTPEQLDFMSYKQLLEQIPAVSDTLREEFMQYAQQTYSVEYGIDIGEANANQFYQLATIDLENEAFSFVGHVGDERWRIRGGNQALAQRMANTLPEDSIYLEHVLRQVRQNSSTGQYLLLFSVNSSDHWVLADRLLLAVPLNQYRTDIAGDDRKILLDLPNLPLAVKNSFTDISYGNNYKFMIFFNKNIWLNKAQEREIATVVHPNFIAWNEGKDGGSSHNSVVTLFISGSAAKKRPTLEDTYQYIKEFFEAVSNIMPLARVENFLGLHIAVHWPSLSFSRGSYGGALLPGQWQQYEQWLKQPFLGALVFAGSEWNREHYGYMNGAVESGRNAAYYWLNKENVALPEVDAFESHIHEALP